MWTRWSKLCTLLLFAALALSGCHGTATKADAGPAARLDAGRDISLGDLSADPGRGDVTLDLGTDPGLDVGFDSPELGPDVLPDGAPGLPHDLGTEVRDVGLDVPPELDSHLSDFDGDSPPDVPEGLPRDVGTDSPLDLGADGRLDAGAWASTSGEPYVLVLSGNHEGGLYRFCPDTVSLVRIGTLSCGTTVSELVAVSAEVSLTVTWKL